MAKEGLSWLVFADDWGRHPSSCQHLVRHLLPGAAVTWVNTIGMRPPRFNGATLRRGLEKLRHWTTNRTADALPPNLRVVSPRMWPWFRRGWDRWVNRTLLTRPLRRLLADASDLPIAVTTLPIVADIMDALPVARWIYYCVDDFGEWPGLDQRTLRRMEERVVERADVVIAVSETLQRRLRRLGRSSELLTHGVDLDFWSHPGDAPELAFLAQLQRPLFLFTGVIDQRMDPVFVERLAGDLERGTILLVGPQAEPDPRVLHAPRVRCAPPVSFSAMPRLLAEADVLVMPYADVPVTRALQPLKLKEYLASGRPAVVRRLPATEEWADCCDVVDTPEEFSHAVRQRLQTNLSKAQSDARRRLATESWSAKAAEFQRRRSDASP